MEKYTAITAEYDRKIKGSDSPRDLSGECWNKLKTLYRFNCFDGSNEIDGWLYRTKNRLICS